MILISESVVDKLRVRYYDGIDFEIISKHSNDGSEGFIMCFIKDWHSEIHKQKRENKINQILSQETIDSDVNNSYLGIYECGDNNILSVYAIVKSKLESFSTNHFGHNIKKYNSFFQ